MSAFQMAAGDSFPIRVGLRDGNGQPITPPPGSTATFRMVDRKTHTAVTATLVLEDDVATWTPSSDDTEVAGVYDAQITVTYPSGEVRKFPSKVGQAALAGFVIEVCPNP